MAQVDSEVYARQLLPKKLGYPMWFPEPFDDGAPTEYKERGTSIGDVGIITANGAFDFLFNICQLADDPANCLGVPSGFEQVVLRRGDISSHSEWQSPGDFIGTRSVKRRKVSVDVSVESNPFVPAGIAAGLQFTSSSREGAVLALPHGAAQYNLRRLKRFKEYALKHGPSWYEFVNGTLERAVSNGSLYLVTGCDKTSSWGVASFSSASEEGEISLKFKAAHVGAGHASYEWQWETQNSVAVRTGPKRIDSEHSSLQSQCVFIRGFKVAVRENPLAAALKGSVNLSSVQNLKLGDIFSKGSSIPFEGGSKSSLFGKLSDIGRQGGLHDNTDTDIEVFLKSEPEVSEPFHPSTVINKYLLESMPEAVVAVTHDDDWCGITEENESVFPNDTELLRRIRIRYQIATEDEGVFLVSPDKLQAVEDVRFTLQQENVHRTSTTRGRGRYTVQACIPCRIRKTRCSGDKPSCQACEARGQDCTWNTDSPKRPHNTQALRKRIQVLEAYIERLEAQPSQYRAAHGDPVTDYPSHPNPRPETPTRSDEGDDAELSNDWDVDHDAERLRALKLEDSDLQLYGPTSIFQFEPKSPGRVSRFPEIVESPNQGYILLVDGCDMSYHNPDFDWCRHLPSEVPLTRQEHDRLLDLLFKFFTSWCLRIVPDLFLRDMYRALNLPRSQTPLKTTHYSPMLHNALVALATAFSDDPDIRDINSRKQYAAVAKSFIDVECQSPNISAVHALSLLGSFHSTQGDQTLGYMYFGMSGRISQALGLSIDASPWVKANLITQNDMLERNWAHWTTFSMDVCWSLYVGREFCVSSTTDYNTIPIPPVDADFDEIPWHYPPSRIPSQPNHLSRTFAQTCELLRVGRQIMDVVNVLNSPETRHNINYELINQIDAQLKAWKAGLPEEVDMTDASRLTATPHRLMLHLTYWQLFILLHRPFYRCTRLSTGSDNDIDVTLCNTAAQHIMELVETWRSLYTLRYIPMALVQVVFSAGTVFLLSAVQAFLRSQPITDLLSRAELCSLYLHEIGRSWQCANHVATILSYFLQEKLKPELLRSASQKPAFKPRRSHQAASPTITDHDPYDMNTSPDWPLSGRRDLIDFGDPPAKRESPPHFHPVGHEV